MKITKILEAEILHVMEEYWGSYLNGDLQTWASYLPDHYRNIGGTKEEVWNCKEEIVDYTNKVYDQIVGMAELRNKTTQIIPYDPYVMVHELGEMYVKAEGRWIYYAPFRLSSLLGKTTDGWKVLHQHGSYPDSKTEEGEAFAFNELKAENKKLWDAIRSRTIELEQKNRELEIEAALEKVRSRSLAVNKVDEFNDVVGVVFEKLSELAIPANTVTIMVYKGDTQDYDVFGSAVGETGLMTVKFELPYFNTPMLDDIRQVRSTSEEGYFSKVYSYEEKNHYYEFAFKNTELKNLPDDLKQQVWQSKAYAISAAYAKNSMIGVNDFEGNVLGADQADIIKRFSRVFEQAYIRFLDLQKAEAQAREARIEAALEKVRSRTMAMHSPWELEEVVAVIAEKLQDLGIILDANGVILCTYFKDSRDVMHWISAPDFSGSGRYLLPYFEHPIFSAAWESKMSGDDYFSRSFSIEEKNSFFEYAFEHSDYKHFPEEFKQWVFQNDKHSLSFAWAENSAILIPSHTGILPTEVDIEILKRFAKVFEQAYVRFMDLQTKEEQAAKIAQEKQRLEKTLRDLQLTQKQLIHAEKMASLGELTAGIAHEIQNPLNFINNFSEVNIELINELKNELNHVKTQYIASQHLASQHLASQHLASQQIDLSHLDEVEDLMKDIESNQQKINHHGKRADAIVKGMLQHSRQSTAEKTATDMNQLADEYLRLAYHGLRAKDKSFNATLHTDFDPVLEPLMVIPQEMGRVLLNLITNAFYAVQEKKKSSGNDYQPNVTVRTKKMADHTLIAVKDNGNGIPQKVLDKIFQPFFTTKPTGQGTGLGLSLSYDMVKAHDGRLEVETEEGAYTVFKIILPK